MDTILSFFLLGQSQWALPVGAAASFQPPLSGRPLAVVAARHRPVSRGYAPGPTGCCPV